MTIFNYREPATSLLARIKTVDGAGSGLDADLLDGLSSAAFQPVDSELTAIAGLTSAANKLPYFTGSGTAALADFTAFGRSLVDDADATAARTTLGLGTIATQSAASVAITGGAIDGTTIGGTTKAAGGFTTVALTSTTAATAGGAGAFTCAGGAYIAGDARVVGVFYLGSDAGGAGGFIFNAAAGSTRDIAFRTAGVNRWWFRVDGTAESGSDAGSDFALTARTDTGTAIDSPIFITRAAGGSITLARPVSLSTASSGLTIAKTTGTTLVVSSTTDATSSTAASVTLAGGLAVAKAVHVGSAVTITHSDDAAGGLILRTATTDATAKNGRIKVQHYTNAEEPFTALLAIAGNGFNQLSWGGSSGVENAATVHVFYTAASSTTLTGTERLRLDSAGNVSVGAAAIATTATDGFLYVTTCPGAPTGAPTSKTGRAPIVIDSTNNKLYFYSGGAWRDAGP